MPEINNKEIKPELKSEQKSAPKYEPQFVLPQRRGYIKYITIPIVVMVVLACAWVAYAFFSQPAPIPATPIVPEQTESEPVPVPDGARYYLAYDSADYTEARIYQYSKDGDKPDSKVGAIAQKNLGVLGKYIKPYTYVVGVPDNKLQILDATTAKLEPLFELPDLALVRDVAVSNDKKWLAYGRNFEGGEKGGSGELWLYNLETKEQKQLVKKTELGMYQGFSVLGWRDNDKEIIVSALGGDAGAIWGDIYQVNIEAGTLEKILPVAEKDRTGFITGQLSPSGEKWLFQYCAQPDQAAIDKSEGFGVQPCTSGTELRTYEFGTEQTKTVYRNLRYDNNVDKSTLRTFMSVLWQDDDTIVAAVPGAILGIPVGSPDKTTELVVYDRGTPQNFINNSVNLIEATPEHLVYVRSDNWFVLNRTSQKISDLNSISRGEAINFWLD